MSILKNEEEYKKTKSFRFFSWLNGEKDPFLDKVEMKIASEVEDTLTEEEKQEENKILMEKVYDTEKNVEIKAFKGLYVVFSSIFCVLFILILLQMVSFSPKTGSVNNPANNKVSERYIEKGLDETGAVNIVTGMILDYRAFDTYGESNVLFIATITVFILLQNKSKKSSQTKNGTEGQQKEDENNDRLYEPKNDLILQVVATFLVPIIMIFGIYVILNGHLSPGGGFSGGAIVGAGLILYLNAFGFKKTEKFFTEKTYKIICFVSLTFYCFAKSYSFFTGANHLESHIPKGTPGAILSSGLILPLNICVGLVVACTMYSFYAMFRKGDF
ncbi:MAG: hypothetical protein IIV45_05425 [Lachnospiraceae bacterium]|nr:hypothetical protein [Lachnospiraceae bacterium]